MRLWSALGLAAAVGVLAGCGGEKPKAADAAPFAAALEDYLKAGSMDMKVDRIESIEVAGDTATVKARMATKEAIYGMKPLWVVTFKKQGDAWKVATWKQEGGG
jgi:hypothetical protein